MANSQHRSAAEIEREIEDERAALTRTLDEIQDRLSFESLSGDFMGRVRENGGDVGRAVARSVRENPVPLALTAVGVAWLIISQARSSRDRDEYASPSYDPDDPYARAAARPTSASYAPAGATRGGVAGAGTGPDPHYQRPVYDASGRPMGDASDDDGESRWDRARRTAEDRMSSAASSASAGVDAARSRAESGTRGASERLSSGYESGRDAVRGGAARARAGIGRGTSAARARAQGAYASAAELRERITHGLEGLNERSRSRILAARTRAYEAQLRAEQYASRGREKASDLFEDQPLVAGALALAVGAAIGGILPRTSREDEAFGAYRDDLFEEAERAYREERAKLEAVARETADEARRVAGETAKDVKEDLKEAAHKTGDIARNKLEDAGGRAKDAAADVGDTAAKSAEDKKLGQG